MPRRFWFTALVAAAPGLLGATPDLLGAAPDLFGSALNLLGAAPGAEVNGERPPGTLLRAATLFDRVSPAVVGIRCRKESAGFDYFGTGSIIDPNGLVLSSISVVPEGASKIEVFLRGGRVVLARTVAIDAEKELVLVQLEGEPPAGGAYPYLRLGDSRQVRLGDPAYTLGNTFRSIETDDEVTLSEGVVSGFIELREKHEQSPYLGSALETTAPLNSGMDGGPLVDGNGELIGLLILNYPRNRVLGTAIPVHVLKPLLRPHRGWFDDRDEGFAAYAGLEIEEVGGRELRIVRVHRGGPADAAGLTAGEAVIAFDGDPVRSMAAFRAAFARARPGHTLRLSTSRDGAERRSEIVLLGKF